MKGDEGHIGRQRVAVVGPPQTSAPATLILPGDVPGRTTKFPDMNDGEKSEKGYRRERSGVHSLRQPAQILAHGDGDKKREQSV